MVTVTLTTGRVSWTQELRQKKEHKPNSRKTNMISYSLIASTAIRLVSALLRGKTVTPDSNVGHGYGDVTFKHRCGVFTLSDTEKGD